MAVIKFKLPEVPFHALRHSQASALIAAGLDVLTISRRLGHGSPVVTLTTYAHWFAKTDTAAADAIEAALKARSDHCAYGVPVRVPILGTFSVARHSVLDFPVWRGGRAVDCGGLENR